MMKKNDEKALIALIATQLHPDAQEDLSRDAVAALIADGEAITTEERAVFEAIDPLSLICERESGPVVIPFPAQEDYEELDMAAGFYRGGDEKGTDDDARESIKKRREAIRERLRKEREDSGDAKQDD